MSGHLVLLITPEMKGPMELRTLSIEPTFSIETGLFTPSRLKGATRSCNTSKSQHLPSTQHAFLHAMPALSPSLKLDL